MGEGSREALFKEWLAEHGGVVVKVARAYTLTAPDAEDLAQEILFQVWRSLPRFEGRASAATWCYRVALNTAIGWRRDDRKRRLHQRPLLCEWPIGQADGAEAAGRKETVERLYAAIRRLPKADAALVLLDLDDLSYRDMAEVLGVSENYIGVKLHRARRALAALLGGASRES